jgi:hypothetical protein
MNTAYTTFNATRTLHTMQQLCLRASRWVSSPATGKHVRINMLKREVRLT